MFPRVNCFPMIKVFIPRQDLYNAGRDSLMFSNPLDIANCTYMTVRKWYQVFRYEYQQNICLDSSHSTIYDMKGSEPYNPKSSIGNCMICTVMQ